MFLAGCWPGLAFPLTKVIIKLNLEWELSPRPVTLAHWKVARRPSLAVELSYGSTQCGLVF